MQDAINSQIHALLTDSDFLELARSQNRPNLFETVAASHTEMWHSAFVKWLIDPQSHLGLGDFPLKRFLFTVLNDGEIQDDAKKPDLTIGELEDMNFDSMEFKVEFTDENLRTQQGGKAKIDVRGWFREVPIKSMHETASVQIIIENKIKARESDDQTPMYFEWAERHTDFQYTFYVFLTPYEEPKPQSPYFTQITYQQLCDQVIKPCLAHPALPDESKYLLQQYLINLGKPLKVTGGRGMALSNKDICQRIYDAHKDVLDEIYRSVLGKAPQGPRSTSQSPNVTLEQLVNNNLLSLSDQLSFTKLGIAHAAELKRQDSGKVIIAHSGQEFNSPSGAARAISGNQEPGWDVWKIRDVQGNEKGTFNDLKNRLIEQQNLTPDNAEDSDMTENEPESQP